MRVNFYCDEHLIGAIPNPVSSIKKAPEYFRKIKPQTNSHPESSTVKRCVPFLDAMSCGYIIPLWCDVFVFAKDGNLEISFPQNFAQAQTLGTHGADQIPDHPLSRGAYGNTPLKWINPWIIETEPGISCLFTSPLNHLETRFKLLDGIVDTDTYYNNVNFPFLWTGGEGEFILTRGTPLVQVIPFRRETCELDILPVDHDRKTKVHAVLGTRMKNKYREEFWNGAKKNRTNPEEIEHEAEDIKLFSEENVSVSTKPLDPLVLENPTLGADNHQEQVTEPVKIEEPAQAPNREHNMSSDILEIVVDNDSRGFGDGPF